jgi:ABC-2 type transport system ATP-binding protein
MNHTVLQTEHLVKHFGSLVAVQDLSLEIYEGEVFGFLGPNGAGKTTSINMMCGLLKPDSGRVSLHGQPITNGTAEVRKRVGVCPQNIILWGHLTCLEQLKFIGEMYGLKGRIASQRALQLLKDLDLDEQRNRQARLLSGGMQRRLNLALALVHDPDILVLDEPEAGLDPQSRVLLRDYIRSLARKKTVVLTTHNMDEAERLADRVAIIDHGQLLVLDTPEALKQRLGLGDVIEISLTLPLPADSPSEMQSRATQALTGLAGEITLDVPAQLLHIRLLNAVSQLAAIIEHLKMAGFLPGQVSLRANSLEDVFISLTGRKLRE